MISARNQLTKPVLDLARANGVRYSYFTKSPPSSSVYSPLNPYKGFR
jgi:hypothetical protein